MTRENHNLVIRALVELYIVKSVRAETLCGEIDPSGELLAEVVAAVDERVECNRQRLADEARGQ